MLADERLLKEAIYNSKEVNLVREEKWFKEIVEPLIQESFRKGIYLLNSDEKENPVFLTPGVRSNVAVNKELESEEEQLIDLIRQTIRLALPQLVVNVCTVQTEYRYYKYRCGVESILDLVENEVLRKGFRGEEVYLDLDSLGRVSKESTLEISEEFLRTVRNEKYLEWGDTVEEENKFGLVRLSDIEEISSMEEFKKIVGKEEEEPSKEERSNLVDERIDCFNQIGEYLDMNVREREYGGGFILYLK